MGTGYSNKFSGTAGARGVQEFYQPTFFDKFPVRTKLVGAGTGVDGIGGSGLLVRNKKCFCCGENSIPVRTEYIECPICGWIDDEYQNTHPSSLNGKNHISLEDARKKYRENY